MRKQQCVVWKVYRVGALFWVFLWIVPFARAALLHELKVNSVPEPYQFSLSKNELILKSTTRLVKISRLKCNEGQVMLFLSHLKEVSKAEIKLPMSKPLQQLISLKENGQAFAVSRSSAYGRFLKDLPDRVSTLRLESKNKCRGGK